MMTVETSTATSYLKSQEQIELLPGTLGTRLRDVAAAHPDRLALIDPLPVSGPPRQWTYAELCEEVERAARALAAQFAPGERVAIWAPSVPHWVLLEYATALAGLVIVPVSPSYRPHELEYILRQSEAAGIFMLREWRSTPMEEFLAQVRDRLPDLRISLLLDDWERFLAAGNADTVLPEVDPESVFIISYTSGTTGVPKGAELTHSGVLNNGWLFTRRMNEPEPATWLNMMPMFHVGGTIWHGSGALVSAATHVLMPRFDAQQAIELIDRYAVTSVMGVPTMFVAILDQYRRTNRIGSPLKLAVAAGAPVAEDLAREIEARFEANILGAYGLTENSMAATMNYPTDTMEERTGTIGHPLANTEVCIRDAATGVTCARGEDGELLVRGPGVMRGYFRMPEATAETITRDGWLRTGDLARVLPNGLVQISGRLKEMVIRGGENIYPREIEDALIEHPAVLQTAVVGVPDTRYGEELLAVVQLEEQQAATEEMLREFLRGRLAPYKIPRHWQFVTEMPLTASGKIQKFVLRERYVGRGGQ